MNWTDRITATLGQERYDAITKAKVGVVGLGFHIVDTIVRAGLGNIIISDHNVYSENNLPNSFGTTLSSLGKNKAEETAKRITDINPACNVSININELTLDDVALFEGCSLMVAINNTINTRMVAGELARKLGIPAILTEHSPNYFKIFVFYPVDTPTTHEYFYNNGVSRFAHFPLIEGSDDNRYRAISNIMASAYASQQIINLLLGKDVARNCVIYGCPERFALKVVPIQYYINHVLIDHNSLWD